MAIWTWGRCGCGTERWPTEQSRRYRVCPHLAPSEALCPRLASVPDSRRYRIPWSSERVNHAKIITRRRQTACKGIITPRDDGSIEILGSHIGFLPNNRNGWSWFGTENIGQMTYTGTFVSLRRTLEPSRDMILPYIRKWCSRPLPNKVIGNMRKGLPI